MIWERDKSVSLLEIQAQFSGHPAHHWLLLTAAPTHIYMHTAQNKRKHNNATGRLATCSDLPLILLASSSQSLREEIRWKLHLSAQFKSLSFSL
jgi:hypothetical protein